MTESTEPAPEASGQAIEQVWVIPMQLPDGPLPALLRSDGDISLYDPKAKAFGSFLGSPIPRYATFEECRRATLNALADSLKQANDHARLLAASIEHIRAIPTANFPDVSREVREQGQQKEAQRQQGQQGEGEGGQKKVTPSRAELNRPRRN